MADDNIPRRDFLKTAGLGTAAALAGGVPAAAPAEAAAAPAAAPEPEVWLALTPTEQAFVKAAVEALGKLKDLRAVEPLTTLRDDPDHDVRHFA